MRLLRILQLGCVTGVAVTPALADQAADDMAKAREVLRSSPLGPVPGGPVMTPYLKSLQLADPTNWREEVRVARDEREKALQAEAKALRAIREKKLADRDAAFALAVTQRAVVVRELALARQRQFETMAPEEALQSRLVAMAKPMEVAAARPAVVTEKLVVETPAEAPATVAVAAVETPVVAEAKTVVPTEAEVEARAQEIVKTKQVALARPADVAVVEAKAAPAELKIEAAPVQAAAVESSAALQEKALSALRAEIAATPAPVLVASATPSTPAPESKRAFVAEPAPAAVREKSADEIALEQRAREILNAKAMQVAKVEPVQMASAAAARDHDKAVSNIREELAASTTKPVLVAQATDSSATTSLEKRAQEIAREQKAKEAGVKAPVVAPAAAPAKVTVTAAPASGLSDDAQRKALETLRNTPTAPVAKTAPAAANTPAENVQPSAAAIQDLRDALSTDSQRKLEDRAREILRERQAQAATPAPAAATAVKTPMADVADETKAKEKLARERAADEARAEKALAEAKAKAEKEKESAAKLKAEQEKKERAAREKMADDARAEKSLAEAKAKAEKEKAAAAAKAPKPAAVTFTPATPAAPAAVVAEPAAPTLDSDSAAKARAELDKAIRASAPAQPAPVLETVVVKNVSSPAPVAAPGVFPAEPSVVVVDPAAEAKAKQELEARAQALLQKQKEAGAAAVVFTSVPQTKQQKIAQLTADYKADKMTPSEYHKRRAEIVAEP